MYDHKVLDFLGLNKTPGDFGVEVEMETSNYLPSSCHDDLYSIDWRTESDGSLKGYGTELVMKKPLTKKSTFRSLEKMRSVLDKHEVKVLKSIRAGVHVHMNVQSFTLADFYKFMIVYYPLETVLLNKCGDNRQGNLFCLRARDADFVIQSLYTSLQTGNFHSLRTNELRYAAMNFQSLFTYGSLEFRAIGTVPSLDNIEVWIEVLERIRDYSLKVKDSWENIVKISGYGPKAYLDEVLGKDLASLFYYDGMENDIIRDVRNVQQLANMASSKGM